MRGRNVSRRTEGSPAWPALALLLGVLPGNIQMAWTRRSRTKPNFKAGKRWPGCAPVPDDPRALRAGRAWSRSCKARRRCDRTPAQGRRHLLRSGRTLVTSYLAQPGTIWAGWWGSDRHRLAEIGEPALTFAWTYGLVIGEVRAAVVARLKGCHCPSVEHRRCACVAR